MRHAYAVIRVASFRAVAVANLLCFAATHVCSGSVCMLMYAWTRFTCPHV